MSRDLDPDEGPRLDPEQDDQPGHALGVTSAKVVVVAVLAGAVAGWMIVRTLELADQVVPVTPWTMVAMMAVVAVGALVAARWMRSALQGPRAAVDNQQAVVALVLGKTMLLTGAALAGGHVAYVLTQVGQWQAPTPRARVVWGSVTVLVSVLFAVAGRVLELACRVPRDPHDDED